jgi:hypothetical protein
MVKKKKKKKPGRIFAKKKILQNFAKKFGSDFQKKKKKFCWGIFHFF